MNKFEAITELNNKYHRIIQLFKSGLIDKEVYSEKVKILKTELSNIRSK